MQTFQINTKEKREATGDLFGIFLKTLIMRQMADFMQSWSRTVHLNLIRLTIKSIMHCMHGCLVS